MAIEPGPEQLRAANDAEGPDGKPLMRQDNTLICAGCSQPLPADDPGLPGPDGGQICLNCWQEERRRFSPHFDIPPDAAPVTAASAAAQREASSLTRPWWKRLAPLAILFAALLVVVALWQAWEAQTAYAKAHPQYSYSSEGPSSFGLTPAGQRAAEDRAAANRRAREGEEAADRREARGEARAARTAAVVWAVLALGFLAAAVTAWAWPEASRPV